MGISGKVDKLIKKYKTRCPYEIANMSNIYIRREDLPTGIMGVAVKALRRKYIILSSNIDSYTERFVCAHELGHHILHPGHSYKFITESLFVNDKYENQANEFAVRLLFDPATLEYGQTKKRLRKSMDYLFRSSIEYFKLFCVSLRDSYLR